MRQTSPPSVHHPDVVVAEDTRVVAALVIVAVAVIQYPFPIAEDLTAGLMEITPTMGKYTKTPKRVHCNGYLQQHAERKHSQLPTKAWDG